MDENFQYMDEFIGPIVQRCGSQLGKVEAQWMFKNCIKRSHKCVPHMALYFKNQYFPHQIFTSVNPSLVETHFNTCQNYVLATYIVIYYMLHRLWCSVPCSLFAKGLKLDA